MRKKAEIKCGIYKITSPSGRVYIGQSRNIEKRHSNYKKYGANKQIKLDRSFIKYGAVNHIFEIIEQCIFEELNNKERYWQDYYDVCSKNGLNCVLVNSEKKTKVLSKKYKEQISKTLYNNSKKEVKPIIQYDLEGNFIREWKNPKEIRDVLKISTDTILLVCKKIKILTCNNYIWRFKNDSLLENELIRIKNRTALSKKVYQYSDDFKLFKTWSSKNEAEKITGFILHNSLHNKQQLTQGFVWSYVKLNEAQIKTKFLKKQKLNKILQYDLEMNFIFEWQSERQLIKEKNLQIVRFLKNNDFIIKQNYIWKLNN